MEKWIEKDFDTIDNLYNYIIKENLLEKDAINFLVSNTSWESLQKDTRNQFNIYKKEERQNKKIFNFGCLLNCKLTNIKLINKDL